MADPTTPPATRQVAKILREVLRRQAYDALPTLTEDLKRACARNHVPYPNDALNEAFRLVGSNTALLAGAPPPPRRLVERPVVREPIIDRAWARQFWADAPTIIRGMR